jgi:hypothetical protein
VFIAAPRSFPRTAISMFCDGANIPKEYRGW